MATGNSTQAQAAPSRPNVDAEKLSAFFTGVREEFHKMTWTPKEDLQAYTKVVVGATFVFGFSIYLMDLVLRGVLNGLDGLVRIIGG